jgi:hypothetical protein
MTRDTFKAKGTPPCSCSQPKAALASRPVGGEPYCHYCDNNREVLDPAKNYNAEMPCPHCRPALTDTAPRSKP